MCLLSLLDIQTGLFQLVVVLEERREIVCYPYTYIPVIEVVVQYRNFDGYRSVQVFGRYKSNFRQTLRTLQFDFLLIDLDTYLCLLQVEVVLAGQCLPILFVKCLNLFIQQGRIGNDFSTCIWLCSL